jgi:uncharacterized protein
VTEIVVGVISDTHGTVRPEAIDALRGCNLLIHAGDVGDPEVIDQLRALAPVSVVRGNVDTGAWASGIPPTEVVEVHGRSIYVLHDLSQLDLDPAAAGFAAVVYGHSHRPSIETRNRVLYLNPGSAGPRRFKLSVTLALLRVTRGELRPEIVLLHD